MSAEARRDAAKESAAHTWIGTGSLSMAAFAALVTFVLWRRRKRRATD